LMVIASKFIRMELRYTSSQGQCTNIPYHTFSLVD